MYIYQFLFSLLPLLPSCMYLRNLQCVLNLSISEPVSSFDYLKKTCPFTILLEILIPLVIQFLLSDFLQCAIWIRKAVS